MQASARIKHIVQSVYISYFHLGEEEIAGIFERDAEGWLFEGTC